MKRNINNVFVYLLLGIGAIIMVFPFVWMVLSSFKTPEEVAAYPPTFFHSKFNIENFIYAFKTAPFARYFINSTIVTLFTVSLTLLTTILAAFAFSRLRFPGRNIMFALSLALMMVPFEMLIITNYSTMVSLGLIDHLGALIIPFIANIFYVFILRNTFLSIPDTLYWSARVDGASNWKYLWRIMVPIAKPTLIAIALLNAIVSWNSFLWPLLVINSTEYRTLPFGLYAFISEGGVRYERLMAAATVVVIPIIILFIFASKSIIKGVSRGGIKG